jgi:hypothetical protein
MYFARINFLEELEADLFSKATQLQEEAARNILFAHLPASKACRPAQALSLNGARYEQGSYRPEEETFTDPGDEPINAPIPEIYVVVDGRLAPAAVAGARGLSRTRPSPSAFA